VELAGKFIVMDMLARDATGSLYGMEMQRHHLCGLRGSRT